MKKKGFSTKLYIIFTVLSTLAAGTACYFQLETLGQFSLKVADLEKQVQQQGDVETQLEEMTLKVQESQAKLDHLEQGVPQRAYMPTLMTELETLGKQNGILVTGVRPMPAKFTAPKTEGEKDTSVRKAYEEQDVEIKGAGHFLKVLAFLSELERFPKIVSVQSVTLSPKNDLNAKGDGSKLEITVELKAYLFPSATLNRKAISRGETNREGA